MPSSPVIENQPAPGTLVRSLPGLYRSWIDAAVLLALFCIEGLWFLPLVRRVGFYLDDWTKFSNLHLADKSFVSWVATGLSDPTLISRPLQILYYAATYSAFGDNPLGYHVLSAAIEVAGAWFLYLAVKQLSASPQTGLVAALLFLLCPLHDSTHYWVGGTLVAAAMTLFLLSFYLGIKSICGANDKCYLGSIGAFIVSIYCYEATVPLMCLIGSAFVYLLRQAPSAAHPFRKALKLILPFVAAGLSVILYQRVLLPHFVNAFLPPSSFDVSHFLCVMQKGGAVCLGGEGWGGSYQRTQEVFTSGLMAPEIVRLSLIALIAGCALYVAPHRARRSDSWSALMILGGVALVSSYTIFGVAKDYMPTVSSIFNRINLGGSLGLVLILAGFVSLLLQLVPAVSGRVVRSSCRQFLPLALVVLLLLFWTLADWGFSVPWILSWQVQQRIQREVLSHAREFKPGDCLLLAGAPRYVMWAPLFDGVWDFQPMLRMSANDRALKGGVVSERLDVGPDKLRDIASGVLTAEYDYKRLKIIFPQVPELIEVPSASAFIEAVKQNGMDFGLPQQVIESWKCSSQDKPSETP